MAVYPIGTRVRAVKEISGLMPKGTGIVLGYYDDEADSGEMGIRWDIAHDEMHGCDGLCEQDHGWWCQESEITIVEMENV